LILYGRNTFLPDQFSQEDAPIIKDAVKLAGYEVNRLEEDKLFHQHRGEGIKHDFIVNKRCPFIVVNQEGINDPIATAWLDSIFSVAMVLRVSKNDRVEKEMLLLKELKQMLPIQPIRLTADGDILMDQLSPIELLPDGYKFPDYVTQDEDAISNTLTGIHKYCGGFMECMRVTEKHKALVCRKCHLRILIPKEIATYAELREYMEESL
jgi:hypothetical protein